MLWCQDTIGLIRYKDAILAIICGNHIVEIRWSFIHNWISYTGKTTFLCWIRAQAITSISEYKIIGAQAVVNGKQKEYHQWANKIMNSAEDWMNLKEVI